MAFLDNSGDIILDAVLTDTGRARLAKGDGSFKIAKFALGDDEIDYTLYNLNNPSGSAYFDLEIMQTPILEAFTNNTSTMKSKLISIPRTNVLYLPILKFNGDTSANGGLALSSGLIYAAVDTDTETSFATSTSTIASSVIRGVDPGNNSLQVVIDQGLNTTEIANTQPLSGDLIETQYIIEIDNRFGSIVGKNGNNLITVNPSFIDDDQIASYYLSLGTDANFISSITTPASSGPATSILNGPVGTRLMFLIKASLDLQSSTFLFQQLGTTSTLDTVPIYQIDSVVRITGATTGYRIDVPVRFIKNQ
jgi:hypothetical protein